MAARPPAFKLPRLLATLPREGRSALVRPAQWPENSFYRVARSKLKFREAEGTDELRASGTAWGQLFWKGKYVPHPRKKQTKLSGGLKHEWVHVPFQSLEPGLRTLVDSTAFPAPLEKPKRGSKHASDAAEQATAPASE